MNANKNEYCKTGFPENEPGPESRSLLSFRNRAAARNLLTLDRAALVIQAWILTYTASFRRRLYERSESRSKAHNFLGILSAANRFAVQRSRHHGGQSQRRIRLAQARRHGRLLSGPERQSHH